MIKLSRVSSSALKSKTRDIAYSPTSKKLARKLVATTQNTKFETLLANRGLEGKLRRISSENLSEGHYFAKITIKNWQKFKGKHFVLKQNGKPIYGNEIEHPARGFPLEYRNIVVTSRYPSKFSLDIPADYSITIGRGAFTTPQQIKYDRQYGVQQSGSVYYSLRGNLTNPDRILVTFPGFGPSTSRISYAVSYLKQITDSDLSKTLMICFQDRYMVSGTYMVTDSSGELLYSPVKAVIDGYMTEHGIADENMMMFGASKGGSTALLYAREYPAAHLVVAVPQMNLPYYLSKPFFKKNLYTVDAMHSIEQPGELARRYFSEGRRIDYFYTENDELSNHSFIEFAQDVPNLAKYRVDGEHGEVARTALPTIIGLMKGFLRGMTTKTVQVEETHSYPEADSTRVQVRIADDSVSSDATNWWLKASLGRTAFYQLMTDHSYPWVKFLSHRQRLHGGRDPIHRFTTITGVESNGSKWQGTLRQRLDKPLEAVNVQKLPTGSQLDLDTVDVADYALVDVDSLYRFTYRSIPGHAVNQRLEIHIMGSRQALSRAERRILARKNSALVVLVHSPDDWQAIDLFALRLASRIRASGITYILQTNDLDEEALKRMGRTAWHSVRVIMKASTSRLNLDQAPLPRWVETGRLILT